LGFWGFGDTTTKYSVVKNTLTKIAAKDAGVEIADDLLTGPSAVAFINGDPIDAAKSLRDFAKENPLDRNFVPIFRTL